MTNAFTNFDTGFSGSQGPFVIWSAQFRAFLLREGSDKVPFPGFDAGIVLDVTDMKTGWQRSDGTAGVPPEWQWNESVTRFAPRPGEDWKQGFHIRCAIGNGQTAVWEQAGASAWNGFLGLVPALQKQPQGDVLPLVKLTGTRDAKFAKGRATIPVLQVASWVPRPASLKDGGIAADPAPQTEVQFGQTPTTSKALAGDAAPFDADLDDVIPF